MKSRNVCAEAENITVPNAPTARIAPEQETVLCKPAGSRNVIIWSCKTCDVECLPVTRESRCLCGHRLKEHLDHHKCTSSKCKCQNFFYIVAEGAWMLRCRCKHKAVEHDCMSPGYKCIKCSSCIKFDSPWVCNCGCGWNNHSSSIIDPLVTPRKIGANVIRKDGKLVH